MWSGNPVQRVWNSFSGHWWAEIPSPPRLSIISEGQSESTVVQKSRNSVSCTEVLMIQLARTRSCNVTLPAHRWTLFSDRSVVKRQKRTVARYTAPYEEIPPFAAHASRGYPCSLQASSQHDSSYDSLIAPSLILELVACPACVQTSP
jgi:hypothetical protein